MCVITYFKDFVHNQPFFLVTLLLCFSLWGKHSGYSLGFLHRILNMTLWLADAAQVTGSSEPHSTGTKVNEHKTVFIPYPTIHGKDNNWAQIDSTENSNGWTHNTQNRLKNTQTTNEIIKIGFRSTGNYWKVLVCIKQWLMVNRKIPTNKTTKFLCWFLCVGMELLEHIQWHTLSIHSTTTNSFLQHPADTACRGVKPMHT